MDGTRSSRFRRAELALFAVLFLSVAWTTAPGLIGRLRTARHMGKVPPAQRLGGAWHDSIRRFRQQLPENEPVALVMRTWHDVHSGIFANYYLYPRPVRIYNTLLDYRADLSPQRPRTVIRIDPSRGDELRLMTYEEIRREQMGEARVIRNPEPVGPARTEMLVPLVAAVDGGPPDSFTTEAVLVAEQDATVTLRLEPDGETKVLQLKAGVPLTFVDVVWDCFGRTGSGWLAVTSTAPVRSAFWFVNRGRRHAALLPAFEELPPLPHKIDGGEKLFVLNADDAAKTIMVNGTPHPLPAHGLLQFPASSYTEVIGEGRMLAFTTRKGRRGETEFIWPR